MPATREQIPTLFTLALRQTSVLICQSFSIDAQSRRGGL
jgi:hypothetical protein